MEQSETKHESNRANRHRVADVAKWARCHKLLGKRQASPRAEPTGTKHSAASQNETAADDRQENPESYSPRRQHDSQLLVEGAEPENTPPGDE